MDGLCKLPYDNISDNTVFVKYIFLFVILWNLTSVMICGIIRIGGKSKLKIHDKVFVTL
jgi:hypothetical protein